MKVREIGELQRKIEEWDGKVAVDTYHIEDSRGIVVISMIKEEQLLYGVSFEGKREEVMSFLTELLPRYREKLLDSQREDVEKIRVIISEHPSP